MNKQQKSFVQMLVNVRDESFDFDIDELIGNKKAKYTVDLMRGYFADRYDIVPLKKPSEYMNYQAYVDYINDEVLNYIYEENTEDMTVDWRQLYICKNENWNNEDNEFL